MTRPTPFQYFIDIARTVAKRSTCARRSVGCVLVDERFQILSTGYNGVASGLTHCIDKPCPGATAKSGEGLHLCEALHAEENAIIQCRAISDVKYCFSTASPCIYCTRRLLNTACRIIVFDQEYPHPESAQLWTGQGRSWLKI
jgi:dCMP deaminase